MHWGFTVNGHADYDEYGYDIVCSAISALTQSVALALQKHCEADYIATGGNMMVHLNDSTCASDVLLDTLRIGLTAIQEEYPNHIRILNKEGECISGKPRTRINED